MHNFDVVIVDYSYMFRLLQNNHHQAVYRKYKEEIILHIDSVPILRLTKVLLISVYMLIVEKPFQMQNNIVQG
jgi:hypothetical protein